MEEKSGAFKIMEKNCYIVATNCITPLGFDVDSNMKALSIGESGIQFHNKVGNISSFYTFSHTSSTVTGLSA